MSHAHFADSPSRAATVYPVGASSIGCKRRDFLRLAAQAIAGTLPAIHARGAWAQAGGGDLAAVSVAAASAALRRGDITAEDYAAALLRRYEANRHLNAFIAIDPTRIMEAARAADRRRAAGGALGVLHGIPLAVKDSVNTKALPTTAASNGLRNFQPATDAPIVARLLDEGAILLGKTNLDELSLGWTSDNAAFGAVRNPYDPSRIPGGSSGGTACAVAARIAPAGLGEDSVGSIRVPSALCGVAGFRPTTGRYPAEGIVPIAPTFDAAGPIARNVVDLALLDSVLSGNPPAATRVGLKGIRLAISRQHYFTDLDAGVERVIAEALAKLKDAGVTLIEAEIPQLAELTGGITLTVLNYEAPRSISEYLAAHRAPVSFEGLVGAAGPAVKSRLASFALPASPNKVSAEAYDNAVRRLRPALQEIYRAYFRQHDVAAIVFPTMRMPAPKITADVFSPAPDVEINGKMVPARSAFARNIAPSSTAGLPGLTIPAGMTPEELPVGLELDGPAAQDGELLALGLAVEAALGPIPAPRGL